MTKLAFPAEAVVGKNPMGMVYDVSDLAPAGLEKHRTDEAELCSGGG